MKSYLRVVSSYPSMEFNQKNEVLYILRDVLSGTVLHAENLLSSDEESIKGIIQSVMSMGYPILGEVRKP